MNAEKLNETINELENAMEQLIDLRDVFCKLDENNQSLSTLYDEIKKTTKKNDEVVDKLDKEIKELKEDVDRSLRTMKEDLREHQLQFNSKIERVQSDIQVEMRKGNEELKERSAKNYENIKSLEANISALYKKLFMVSLFILGVSLATLVVGIIL